MLESFLLPLITCSIIISLTLVILPSRIEIKTFRPLIELCLASIFWHGSWAVMFYIDDMETSRTIAILGHIGILYIPVALNNLYERIFERERSSYKYLIIIYFISLFFLFNGLIIDGVREYDWGFYPKAGLLHPVFLLVVFYVVISNFYIGVRLALSEKHALRRKSVLFSTLSCGVYSLAAYDFLINYNMVTTYPYGFLATIGFIMLMTGGIIKYDLRMKITTKKKLYNEAQALQSVLSERTQDILDLRASLVQKEKLASIGLISSGVAHQLGNTLNVISTCRKSLNNFIKNDEKDEKKYRKIIEKIADAVELSKIIIISINSLGRENDVLKLNKMHGLVKSGIILTKGKSLEKVQMVNNVDPSLEVLCSQSSVIQVMMCVLSNAVDAMEYGGKIVVSSEVDEKGVKINIKDEGTGIPEDLQDIVFEPFVTSKHPDEGTGLGLYLAKKEMEKNHGTISFNTGPKGTIFTLKFETEAIALTG